MHDKRGRDTFQRVVVHGGYSLHTVRFSDPLTLLMHQTSTAHATLRVQGSFAQAVQYCVQMQPPRIDLRLQDDPLTQFYPF
jgi:hypothetical protein